MAPSDREFDALIRRLEAMDAKLDAMREEAAEFRGAVRLMKWASGGGLIGMLTGLASLWHSYRGMP